MGFYINSELGYYEGDRIDGSDLTVPQRPDSTYTFDASTFAWKESTLFLVLPTADTNLNNKK